MKYLFPLLLLSILLGKANAQQLSSIEAKIAAEVQRNHAATLRLLEEIVNINSGSLNIAGVKAVGEKLATEYRKIGFTTEWVALPDSLKRAGHLVAYRKGTKGKRLLLLGHLDTVFEPDMDANPFRMVTDTTATGQGVVDMKGGDVMMLAICQALYNLKLIEDATIICYYTGDEESTGRPEWLSREDMIARAKQSDISLGFETAQGFGTVAIGRRGSSQWKLNTEGVQSHSAGMFSAKGSYGAIYEASRILNEFREKLSSEKYLTFSPGVIAGGTELNSDDKNYRATVSGKTNIIASSAVVHGDLRFLGEAQKENARNNMRAIVANSLQGTKAQIEFYDGFPSMEPRPGNAKLVEILNQISLDMGLGPVKAGDPGSRGAGDISWIAQYVDCIDGLGASGGGAHAPGEIINLKELPLLTQRSAILVYRLTR